MNDTICFNLSIINKFIDVKLLLITISLTIAYLYVHTDNIIILKKKYDYNINDYR